MATRILLLAAIALCAAFTGGPWNFPLAAWLGMFLTLRYYRLTGSPVRDFLLLSLLTGAVTAALWQGAVPQAVTGPLPTAVLFLAMAPLGMAPYVLDRWTHRRCGATLPASLAFPVAVTAWDTLGTSSSDVGTFGALGYSQAGATPVMQLAALGGLPLIAFTLSWTASLGNLIWERRTSDTTRGARAAFVALGLIAAALAVGAVRPATADPGAASVRVAGVSLPGDVLPGALAAYRDGDGFGKHVDETRAFLVANAGRLAGGGAEVVVFSEAAGFGTPADVAQLRAALADVAREHGTWIVLPTLTLQGVGPAVNAVEVIDADGQVVLNHVKYGGNAFEGTRRGTGVIPTVDAPFGRLAAVVCWDADFPGAVAQAGRAGVDLLVVPANDWAEVRTIHSQMSVFRAVENSTALFRQTSSGVSLATDAYGRVLGQVDSFTTTGAPELVVDVALHDPPTLFPWAGATVGVAAQIAALLLIGWLAAARLRDRRRPPQGSAPGSVTSDAAPVPV